MGRQSGGVLAASWPRAQAITASQAAPPPSVRPPSHPQSPVPLTAAGPGGTYQIAMCDAPRMSQAPINSVAKCVSGSVRLQMGSPSKEREHASPALVAQSERSHTHTRTPQLHRGGPTPHHTARAHAGAGADTRAPARGPHTGRTWHRSAIKVSSGDQTGRKEVCGRGTTCLFLSEELRSVSHTRARTHTLRENQNHDKHVQCG